ncbi:hypothetical protein BDZ97DRAFT_64738 [Flammula alnicola]|nr:hypothetical protein BDZ97DRAFT_64738 [Flammula alnicola]
MQRTRSLATLSFILSSVVVSNAQTASNSPPPNGLTSTGVVNSAGESGAFSTTAATPSPASSAVAGANSSTSPSTTLPLPASTTSIALATTSSNSDSVIEIPHSPVPMVAGSLAGFIAILAAILVTIVARRRKRRHSMRRMQHMFAENDDPGEFSDDSTPSFRLSSARNPFFGSHTTPDSATKKTSGKRNSRYEYTNEDVELERRDSVPRNIASGDVRRPRSSNSQNGRRRPTNRHRQSRYAAHSGGATRTTPSTKQTNANTPSADVTDRNQNQPHPQSRTQTQPHPTSALASSSPGSVGSALPNPGPCSLPSNAQRPSQNSSNTQQATATNSPPQSRPPVTRLQGGEDLPPAYENLR